jgi:hypothetical protein
LPCQLAQVSGAPTAQPPIVTIPVISLDRPTSTFESLAWTSSQPITPSSSPSLYLENLEGLPRPTFTSLHEPFEFPHQLIPIDKADPTKVIGDGYTVELSPSISTVFVYDVRPEFAGRTCTLALHMPQMDFEFPQTAPVKVRVGGGVSVSRLAAAPESDVNAQNVGDGSLVGTVPMVLPAHQYNIASFPCEAGQRVGYQVDSIGGLDMDWFQMTYPALGLFMQVD